MNVYQQKMTVQSSKCFEVVTDSASEKFRQPILDWLNEQYAEILFN